MPAALLDDETRAKHEARITRALVKARAAQREKLVKYLGMPPRYENVPDWLWREIEEDDRALLLLLLLTIAVDAARRVQEQLGTEGDPAIIGQKYAERRATRFAREGVAATKQGIRDLFIRVRKTIRRLKGEGADQSEAEAELAGGLDSLFGRDRAESAGITETTAADTGGGRGVADRARDAGVEVKLYWVTERDAKVCPVCRPLHGTEEPVWSRVVPGGPPAHPRCLLPETEVLASGVVATTAAHYHGPAIRLVMRNGRTLSITPNHELLGPQGFVRADRLSKGDNLICCLDLKRMSLAAPDDHHGPSRVEDVVRAFAKSGGVSSCPVPVTPEYLHGDAVFCNGDIDVVWSHRLLGHAYEPSLRQQNNGLPLIAGWDRANLVRLSDLDAVFGSLSFASHGVVGSLCESLPFFRTGFAHPQEHRTTLVSGRETSLSHPSRQCDPTDAQSLRCLQDRFPGLVAIDQVVDIHRFSFHGSVFDLQTVTGLYCSNGIISSNCRCSLRYSTGQRFGQSTPARPPNV